ncbi:MAG: hypothetical protein LAT83_19665 [Kiritimatiellae bacterium]|nr:hypothetical protein [Kiritimatiellia bacterium]
MLTHPAHGLEFGPLVPGMIGLNFAIHFTHERLPLWGTVHIMGIHFGSLHRTDCDLAGRMRVICARIGKEQLNAEQNKHEPKQEDFSHEISPGLFLGSFPFRLFPTSISTGNSDV